MFFSLCQETTLTLLNLTLPEEVRMQDVFIIPTPMKTENGVREVTGNKEYIGAYVLTTSIIFKGLISLNISERIERKVCVVMSPVITNLFKERISS
jgi:hypothetical protein